VTLNEFCEATHNAVAAFQKLRSLHISGVCDHTTWLTLVESSFELGDRLLYLTTPLLRGDDVAKLQLMLSRLGFDCGRVDGFLGKITAKIITEFQQNYGLVPDGICGPQTLQALMRASRNSGVGPGVGIVRERHTSAKYPQDLAKLRVVIGQFTKLDRLTNDLADRLRSQHTHVALINDVDQHRHAQLANDFAANIYIGIEARDQQVCEIAYYHTEGFHSVAAHVFATIAAEKIERSAPWFKPVVSGMRLQVLRETSMPAVVCGFGPTTRITPHSAVLADDLANALSTWVKTTSMKLSDK
jgi:N-acetylmuramoyl-L-alanine amidase